MAAIPEAPVEALARDGALYAAQYGVTLVEAMRRLRLQQESVAAVDALALAHADRLAGIFIEHVPDYRVVLLLTGIPPIPDERIAIADLTLTVEYRTGAPATRAAVLAALSTRAGDIRAAMSYPPGMGANPRSGMLVVVVRSGEIASEGAAALATRLGAIAGVPVEIRSAAGVDSNSAIEGGSRLLGSNAGEKRRFLCTSGFVVTDGARTAITTAAHCPDEMRHIDATGGATPLRMIGAWGARYQDVQIHEPLDPAPPLEPLFRADAVDGHPRRLTSWRNRASTRVGDYVCHRGERTGYSCAEVEFVDYVPPGDLCAGACDPVWVAVKGPTCRGGDSGGPVFSGTVAFGIVKGSSYTTDGTCRRYYYMSTDYLPAGWTLLH
ncbi:hypothetical protein FOY91_07005 [Sphingomonas solaris]|uniref:Trypsin-like serine protease n=1 Tax=Alterirhizorhabdus solaris TaxID=2529389 RepID=A0A558R814_9SPHN|nr:hypothetical protein FOY91_07005 [Sphingomonas solaris]